MFQRNTLSLFKSKDREDAWVDEKNNNFCAIYFFLNRRRRIKKVLKKLNKLVLVSIIIISFANTTAISKEYSKKNMFVHPGDITLEYATDRARQTVKMLDDMYKTFMILITKEYVTDSTMFSAVVLTKKVFEAMSKKGWHEARLLGTSGTLYNPDNFPKDDFERDATKALISGKNYYEKVEMIDGKYYLRVATSVPASAEGCTICHPDKKVGDILGAISYKISLNKFFR